jgi:hypothetical protein
MSWFFRASGSDGGSDDEQAQQWTCIDRRNADEKLVEEAFQKGDDGYIINAAHRVDFTTMKLISCVRPHNSFSTQCLYNIFSVIP